MYDFGIRNALSGYRVQYRRGEDNHCPGCGGTSWHIGRMSAECAFCGTAVEIVGTPARGYSSVRRAA